MKNKLLSRKLWVALAGVAVVGALIGLSFLWWSVARAQSPPPPVSVFTVGSDRVITVGDANARVKVANLAPGGAHLVWIGDGGELKAATRSNGSDGLRWENSCLTLGPVPSPCVALVVTGNSSEHPCLRLINTTAQDDIKLCPHWSFPDAVHNSIIASSQELNLTVFGGNGDVAHLALTAANYEFGLTDGWGDSDGVNTIVVRRGVCPTTPVSNGIQLCVENVAGFDHLYVVDGTGTKTLLSPHEASVLDGFDSTSPLPIAQCSSNAVIGKEVCVDIVGLAMKLDPSLVKVRDIPKMPWAAFEQAKRQAIDNQRAEAQKNLVELNKVIAQQKAQSGTIRGAKEQATALAQVSELEAARVRIEASIPPPYVEQPMPLWMQVRGGE